MPDFERWRASQSAEARALETWARISDQPTTITIQRAGVSLAAQTVRIEFSDQAREDVGLREGLNVMPGIQRAIVFGVQGHPTVADTDIERGDRFVVGATEFEVIGVIRVPEEVQAVCEARTIASSGEGTRSW